MPKITPSKTEKTVRNQSSAQPPSARQYSHRQSTKVALCGVLAALSFVLLLLSNMMPLAVYCAPMLAAFLLIPVLTEFTPGDALLLYAVVSILSLLLLPDKEPALIYALVLGHYPVTKSCLDPIHQRGIRVVAKLAVFNAGLAAAYWLLLALFVSPALLAEWQNTGRAMLAAMLLIGNASFLIDDRALQLMTIVYRRRLHPKLKKILHG